MIYEILDADPDEIRMLKQRDLKIFNEGFELYQTQKIKKAHSLFEDLVANNPEDGVAKLYLDRCAKLLQTGWNSKAARLALLPKREPSRTVSCQR